MESEDPFFAYLRVANVEGASPKIVSELHSRFLVFRSVWKTMIEVVASNPDLLDDFGIECFEYVDGCIEIYEQVITSQINMVSN